MYRIRNNNKSYKIRYLNKLIKLTHQILFRRSLLSIWCLSLTIKLDRLLNQVKSLVMKIKEVITHQDRSYLYLVKIIKLTQNPNTWDPFSRLI